MEKFHSELRLPVGTYIEDNDTGDIMRVLACKPTFINNKLVFAITAQVVDSRRNDEPPMLLSVLSMLLLMVLLCMMTNTRI